MRTLGVDIGTMNVVSAEMSGKDNIETNSIRNMFIEISTDIINAQELSNTQLDYVIAKSDEDDDIDKAYVIGDDAFKFSQIFGKDVSRPMAQGVISKNELYAIDVLTLMMEKLIGKSSKSGGHIVYSVPAASVDIDTPPVLFHERIFGNVFSKLGYDSKPINEAMAVVYSNCASSQFSGIGISFGAGLTNICCSYKGTTTLAFAVSRGGDWIDKAVADSVGAAGSRVTAIKEKDLNLLDPVSGKRKERIVKEALQFYYANLIEYVLKVIAKYFEQESGGLDIDEKIPIVVSGGTSLADGFIDLFKDIFSKFKDFPYEISEIRPADDPLTAVAQGCLIYGLWETKKNKEKTDDKKNNDTSRLD